MSRKRGRSASRAEIAAAIGARTNAKYPVSEYGRAYMRRGYEPGRSMFGPSYAEATPVQRGNRKDYGYVGRGKYWGKALGSAIGGIGGMLLGGPKGAAIGASAGGDLGDKWSGRGIYTGRGLYNRSNPAAQNELIGGSNLSSPKFQSVGDESGSLMVSHREYIGDIFAPDAANVSEFTVQSFPINPGLEQSFPWLSQIAQNYEEYEMVQCVYEYVSVVDDVSSANGQVGTVITATQYNSSRPDFADKSAMAAYAHSCSSKTTENQNHGVECDPSKMSGAEGKYIRANPVMTGEDLKTYDHGRFQLATHNIPAAMAGGSLGELYVSYTVKLRKPKFFTGRGLGLTRFLAVADNTKGNSGITTTLPFGTDAGALVAKQNNFAVKVERTDNTTTLTFPAYFGGRLRIMFILEGQGIVTSGSNWFSGLGTVGNVSFVQDIYAGGATDGDSPGYYAVTGDSYRQVMYCSVNVSPVTNAVNNKLVFVTDITGWSFGNQSMIEISEHNTFGSAGAAQLVNAAGTAVTL